MKILVVGIFLVWTVQTAMACLKAGGLPMGGGGGGGGGGDSILGNGKKKCLHEDSLVLMADGHTQKRAGDLLIGDQVWSDWVKSTAVILMPTIEFDGPHPFITFKTKSGLGTTLTPDHAVFARPCGSPSADTWPIKRSADLTIGECVPTADGDEDQVSSIVLEDMPGRVHPITENGKLVVDGVIVSCYDYSEDEPTQQSKHAPFEPARILYSLGEKIYGSLSNEQYALGLLDSLVRGLGLEKLYE